MPKKINLNLLDSQVIPTPAEIVAEIPATEKQIRFIQRARQEVQDALFSHRSRLLLIAGPCSIHDIASAKEYARRFAELAKEVSDTFVMVMRVYFEKPRTTLGWKGMIYDPFLDGSNAMSKGLRLTRQLLLELAEMEVPAAAEFLDPLSAHYFSDLITWGCIGARTSESQTHRQMASSLPMPVAFKNNTMGNVDVAVHGVLSAAIPHTYLGIDPFGKVCQQTSAGNSTCHIVLRGGEANPNYDPESISYALDCLQKNSLPPKLLIDCSHDNSRRKHQQQVSVFQSVIHQIKEGEKGIRGLILESNLEEGQQPMESDELRYGVSVTDACLDWETTAKLIRWGRTALLKEASLAHPQENLYALS